MNAMNCLSFASLGWLVLHSWALAAQQKQVLELTCYPIPASLEALCPLVTASPHGPFDDVAFYKRDPAGNLRFLRSITSFGATFSFQGTSPSGQYTALAWAEEGHPSFEIYRTDELLQPGKAVLPLTIIAEYPFSHLDEINDDGWIIYGSDDAFHSDSCDVKVTALMVSDVESCHRIIKL